MGDVCEIAQPDEGVDPAVDFGSIHHASGGHAAIAEIGAHSRQVLSCCSRRCPAGC